MLTPSRIKTSIALSRPAGLPDGRRPRRGSRAPGAGLYQEPGRQGPLRPRQHPRQRRRHQEARRGEQLRRGRLGRPGGVHRPESQALQGPGLRQHQQRDLRQRGAEGRLPALHPRRRRVCRHPFRHAAPCANGRGSGRWSAASSSATPSCRPSPSRSRTPRTPRPPTCPPRSSGRTSSITSITCPTGLHVLLAGDLTKLDDPAKDKYPGKKFGDEFPLAWRHQFDGGREWYTALGHKPEHYSDPQFTQHILGGILWAMGESK